MIPLAMVNGYDLALTQLSTAALGDLRALMNAVEGLPPERAQRTLQEAFPEVFNPYAAASSAVSASFYEEVRDYVGVGGSFAAETLDSAESSRWGALVGYGSAPSVFERGGSALAYSLLAGGLTSVLSEMAGDTIYGNAENERVTVGFQRVPKPGCCGFCGMLASRGAAYQSEESASRVVGGGVPVERTRGKRGGQGRGIRTRGTRRIGEKFHDHCQCRTVQVYEDNAVEMRADADKYLDAYLDARDQANDGLTLRVEQSKSADGSLKNKYRWVDAGGKQVSREDKTKMIATAMRHELDVK